MPHLVSESSLARTRYQVLVDEYRHTGTPSAIGQIKIYRPNEDGDCPGIRLTRSHALPRSPRLTCPFASSEPLATHSGLAPCGVDVPLGSLLHARCAVEPFLRAYRNNLCLRMPGPGAHVRGNARFIPVCGGCGPWHRPGPARPNRRNVATHRLEPSRCHIVTVPACQRSDGRG
jgi:hypothetical protein